MLLKSIKLKNFRQLIDSEIHFSTSKDKNVTFVLGNNSTGKTTIANAFTWCLFGFHHLPDPHLLNKNVAKGLKIRETANIEVEVILRYGEQDYAIRRSQVQQLKSSLYGKAKLDITSTTLEMTFKDSESGVTRIIDPDKVQDRINLIIPQDLASYFFIRAEQMTSMADATQQGKLSNNLADAVEKILGMQAIKNAVKHLTGQQNSVCALLQKELNSKADVQMEKAINEIEECKSKVDRNKELVKNEEGQITTLIERNMFLTGKIKEGADGEKVQTELEERDKELKRMNTVILGSKSEFLKKFALDLPKLCYKDLISDAIEILKTTEITDKHVPKVTRETIEFLLKRGECICGQTLQDNNDYLRTLIKLIDYVPPVSIASTAAAYVEGAKSKISPENLSNLALEYEQYKTLQREVQSKIEDEEEAIEKLIEKLKSHKSTAKYESERSDNNEKIKDLQGRIRRQLSDNVEYESRLKKAEKQLIELSQADSKNREVANCLKHAKYIAKVLDEHLNTKETELREKLTKQINEIFSSVFSSTHIINLDSNYKITITDEDGQDFGTGGAQSVSVVLAFITSVLNLAKQIHYDKLKNKEEVKFLTTEPYPLFLDAPFSSFDNERIMAVSPKLPLLTEQIIIFSKNTEGDLTKKYIYDKIGKYYEMSPITLDDNKKDVLETKVEERDINAIN